MKDFYEISEMATQFINSHSNEDHVFVSGNNSVLISIPHGVSQTRLGKKKLAEPGSVNLGLTIADCTNSHILVKTKNNFDDANFDESCDYRNTLLKVSKEKNIKYVLDFHSLSKKNKTDINLGTNLGNNIITNHTLLDELINILTKNDFNVSVDHPFHGGYQTISGFVSRTTKVWAVQIEVNSRISYDKDAMDKFHKLAQCLTTWINQYLK